MCVGTWGNVKRRGGRGERKEGLEMREVEFERGEMKGEREEGTERKGN